MDVWWWWAGGGRGRRSGRAGFGLAGAGNMPNPPPVHRVPGRALGEAEVPVCHQRPAHPAGDPHPRGKSWGSPLLSLSLALLFSSKDSDLLCIITTCFSFTLYLHHVLSIFFPLLSLPQVLYSLFAAPYIIYCMYLLLFLLLSSIASLHSSLLSSHREFTLLSSGLWCSLIHYLNFPIYVCHVVYPCSITSCVQICWK